MLVYKWMTQDPMTVQTEETVTHAAQLMKDHSIRHLPVLSGKKLVGIVSDRDLKEYSPSPATTLDVYELHYLLSKTTVDKAMHKNPLFVHPGDTIEKAALLMHDKGVGCLPVLDDEGAVVGILTDYDVFEALVRITGCRSDSTRLQMTIPDEPGSIKIITDQARSHGLRVSSILTTTFKVPEGKRELIVRVKGDPGTLEAELRKDYPDLIAHKGC
jgi:acetoin utilization protein AcuB